MRFFRFLLIPVCLVAVACSDISSEEQPLDVAQVETDIRAVYKSSITSWNNRDMEGYMRMYWNSDQFRTVSGDRAFYGWQNALDMSVNSDPEGKYMDPSFTDYFELNVLNDTTAYGMIVWRTQNDSVKSTGASTDIWRLKPEGWRIVHSHISYAY